MDLSLFVPGSPGHLVPIHGADRDGSWTHSAFVPDPLPAEAPDVSGSTYRAIADARASLSALDARAEQLPNPALLRRPTLRIEAQSTSALEGTFKPLDEVLGADELTETHDADLREVMNYVVMADRAFAWLAEGRPINVGLLEQLQKMLVRGTRADTGQAGRIRTDQVAIGAQAGLRAIDARFVPSPPGIELEVAVRDCVEWLGRSHRPDIDPVMACAMAHYQFETLHPFNDGNGRLGRLLIILQLLSDGVLREPTLAVSPWFEARRSEYQQRLLDVSTRGAWDAWVRFFADGIAASAEDTGDRVRLLLAARDALRARIRADGIRTDNAQRLVDLALERSVFSVRAAASTLDVTVQAASALIRRLVDIEVLAQYGSASYDRRFTAPEFRSVMLGAGGQRGV